MNTPIHSVAELGLALRAVRKTAKVRLDDLAAITGVSKQFLSDVERGKSSVQFGLVLKLLEEMGVALTAQVPDAAAPALALLRDRGGLPSVKPRAKPSVSGPG